MFCKYCMEEIGAQLEHCPHCGKKLTPGQPDYHLPVGTVLNNKYLVGAALGEGGFGITYVGKDRTLERRVAIKEYYPAGYAHRNTDPRLSVSCTWDGKEVFERGRERFLREARALAQFSGEAGIVDVLDFFQENNTAYIIMEYLDGITLKEHLKNHPLLSPEQAVHLLTPVMRSLERVHLQGLVHRDISPDNIMLVQGKVKLLDFGAARDTTDGEHTISVILKPGYAPEEQYRSKGKLGPWTDIYSLCATFYKCITGVTPDDAVERVYRDELKPPSALGIRIDPGMEQALMKGLSVQQQDRYQSIGALRKALRETRTRTMPEEPPEKPPEKPPENPPKKPPEKPPKKPPEEQPQKPPEKPPQAAKQKKGSPLRIFLALLLAAAVAYAVKSCGGPSFQGGTTSQSIEKSIAAAETRLTLNDADLTKADLSGLASLSKLESLRLKQCTVDEEVLAQIAAIPGSLQFLTIQDCAGCGDLSGLSQLGTLSGLTLDGCGLEEQQLKTIDFAKLPSLHSLDLSNNPGLSDLTCLDRCVQLRSLSVNGCGVSDLGLLPGLPLEYLDIDGNGVTDMTPLTRYSLYALSAKDNQLTNESILPLAGMENLTHLELDRNLISVLPVLGARLETISVNDNQLTSLSGLEAALGLTEVEVAQNALADIDGLKNCTRLKRVDLGGNQLSDISLLAKSAATLEEVFLNDNRLTSLEALRGTPALKTLNVTRNGLTSLAPLLGSRALEYLAAGQNQITSLTGLEDAAGLKGLYLPYNQISDMDPLSGLASQDELDLDLSHNRLTSLALPRREYEHLALYDNPLEDLSPLQGKSCRYLLLSYREGTDYSVLKDCAFSFCHLIDCPPDQQETMKDFLGTFVSFQTMEEAEQEVSVDYNLRGYEAPSENEDEG